MIFNYIEYEFEMNFSSKFFREDNAKIKDLVAPVQNRGRMHVE